MLRKRGRPKIDRPSRDAGTPELAFKRAHGETMEPLDLCLERGLLTAAQHWCGIHLRWLYTLRYGAPGVRAVDTTHLGGLELKMDDPGWRAAREEEYHMALRLLGRERGQMVLGLAVHNERPAFLARPPSARLQAWAARAEAELARLNEAFGLLEKHWR